MGDEKMIKVFICGPFRDALKEQIQRNISTAEVVALHYWRKGYNVYCPHLNSGAFHGKAPDRVFLRAALEELESSRVVVVLPGWESHEGCRAEVDLAHKLKKDIVFLSVEAVLEFWREADDENTLGTAR